MKHKFFKNLYPTVSWFLTICVLVFFLLFGYFESLSYENGGQGWLLLVFAGSVIVLFFLVGFYWIFQTVEIDQTGITTKIFKKTIRKVDWNSVEDIRYANVMRNPAYVLKIKNEKNLNLDCRKQIRIAIAYFGNPEIKNRMKEMIR